MDTSEDMDMGLSQVYALADDKEALLGLFRSDDDVIRSVVSDSW